jgi:hypothetical protein
MGTFMIYTANPCIVVGNPSHNIAQFSFRDAPSENVNWTSSDITIATIDENSGLATAVAESATPVTITATSGTLSAHADLWIGSLSVTPQNTGADADKPVTFTAAYGNTTVESVKWKSFTKAVAKINKTTGEAKVVSLGVTIIRAKWKDPQGNKHYGYAALHGGTLLVYGADGTLYRVPAEWWSVASIDPPTASGVPLFTTMNPQGGTPEFAVFVPPTAMWTTCYVLNPSPAPVPSIPITPPPSSTKKPE